MQFMKKRTSEKHSSKKSALSPKMISSKIFLASAIVLSLAMTSALTSCAKPGDATVTKGMVAFKEQNLDAALVHFKQALNEETRYSPELLLTFISRIYTMQNDLTNAIEYQEKALSYGGDYLSFVNLGMAYHMNGQDEKAAETYKKAIAMDENRAEAYASLGALYLGKNDFEKAKESLLKAESIAPNLSIIHGNLALVYANLGEKMKSEAELIKAEELKCDNLDEFKIRVAEILEKK